MAECDRCNSEIPDNHPAVTAKLIEDSNPDWDAFGNGRYETWSVGSRYPIVPGKVFGEVISVKGYDGEPGYYAGELPQGTEYDAHVVLKVGDHYFMATGLGDSYSSVTWDKTVKVVQPEIKQVTVYEF